MPETLSNPLITEGHELERFKKDSDVYRSRQDDEMRRATARLESIDKDTKSLHSSQGGMRIDIARIDQNQRNDRLLQSIRTIDLDSRLNLRRTGSFLLLAGLGYLSWYSSRGFRDLNNRVQDLESRAVATDSSMVLCFSQEAATVLGIVDVGVETVSVPTEAFERLKAKCRVITVEARETITTTDGKQEL